MESNPYWESILKQEGTPFEVVSEDFRKYPLLIVSRLLDAEKRKQIMDYLEKGGLVLSFTVFFEEKGGNKKISSLVPSGDRLFDGIPFLSFDSDVYLLKDESYENIENIAFVKKIGKGKLILLSFDLAEALGDIRYYPAPIFTTSGPIFQILPRVSRNAIRKLVRNCLIDLFNHADLPYVRLSNFPGGFNSAFVFRVDADNYDEKEFSETARILYENKIKTTYFINQSSYQNYLDDLTKLRNYGFEVQSHMNKHCVYDSVKKNYENLAQSLEFLKDFKPNAFVAPFGIFNKSLLSAAEKLGMNYSSEFSYDYDSLPSFPIVNGRVSKVLQLPIHPVCLESFIEVGWGDSAMLEHFDYMLKKSVSERMPIFWYGHPTKVFREYPTYFQVLNQTLNKINKIKGIWKTNFSEFYEWWITRLGFEYSIHFDGKGIFVKWSQNLNVDLEIFYKNKFKVSNLKSYIDLRFMNKMPKLPVQDERNQYRRSLKDALSKLKLYFLNKYLNYKNMQ